jgi:UDP-N-acetylglucosamine 2-epimerase (non-hydrolysing)
VKKLVLVAGARPNFMKIAPIIRAIRKEQQIAYALVHTGQHYDEKMSQSFFDQLAIPHPDVNLEAGGGTQAEQTATIMVRFEKYLMENPCDAVLVVGDVTSTLACSIVSKKLGIPVAHVEGGIRSGDWSMPEEINRVVTDSISNYFFTTSIHANENLKKEGKSDHQIFFVGNTMIDSLLQHKANFRKPWFWDERSLKPRQYFVLTLHRPANVDSKEQLSRLLKVINQNAHEFEIIFPVHPRTLQNIRRFEIDPGRIFFTEPLGYLEFNFMVQHALGVITDSGGITEETTVLGIPCITLRDSTERPETCFQGTNELIGTNPDKLPDAISRIIDGKWKKGTIPEKWDGKAGERIVEILSKL